MKIKKSNSLYIAVSVLFLASLACSSIQPSAEPISSEGVEAPQEDSADVPATEVESDKSYDDQVGGLYDGSWTGTNTVDGKEILFTVEDNQVTSVALNYTGEASGCDYAGAVSKGANTGSLDAATIENAAFSLVVESVNDELTFTGAFTSENEASGTLVIKSSPDGLCGAYEKEVSWTATKGSSADAEATEDTSGMASQDDTIAIVNQFFDAVNAGNVDAAIDMVDENVMFSIGGSNTQFGRDNLKTLLSSSGHLMLQP